MALACFCAATTTADIDTTDDDDDDDFPFAFCVVVILGIVVVVNAAVEISGGSVEVFSSAILIVLKVPDVDSVVRAAENVE